jgi:cytochrome c553
MKRTIATLLFGLLAALVGALLFAWSGLYSVAASKGHWPITRWFLDFALENSVETHSIGITVPELNERQLVVKGAGHYETGCAPCHSAPGRPRSPIVTGMTPAPPELGPMIGKWDPAELFWIVRHGLKYTAMPPWPAPERVDEVWAMVAFLLQLPDLSPSRYRELAFGPVSPDPEESAGAADHLAELVQAIGPIFDECARCHGRKGEGRGSGAFPKLWMQSEDYLDAALRAYAAGERRSGIMQPMAAGLTEEQTAALARYYAEVEEPQQLRAISDDGAVDPAAIAAGAEIANQGIPEEGVPACLVCHGPGEPRNPLFPRLAGQYADYVALQLRLFAARRRGGTPYAEIMRLVASRLTEEQIENVALYFATLEPRLSEQSEARSDTYSD